MNNIKQANRLIKLKVEMDSMLRKLQKDAEEEKTELKELFEQLNESLTFNNFKKKMNQILIGILKDKGLTHNNDFRVNNHRLYLHSDDTLWYKGYAQKIERELDIFDSKIERMFGEEFLEQDYIKLLQRGREIKDKLSTEIKEAVGDKILVSQKVNETYGLPAWTSGKIEQTHVKELYIKITVARYRTEMDFEIKKAYTEERSTYTNQEDYLRPEHLQLFPSYRNAANKLIKQAKNKVKQMTDKILKEEDKLTKKLPTKYATYLLLRGITK